MINIHGRLQRLNRAVLPPSQAHDDWEILRDLAHSLGSPHKPSSIEEVFAEMSSQHPEFRGLSLSKIGDLGLPLKLSQATAPTAAS